MGEFRAVYDLLVSESSRNVLFQKVFPSGKKSRSMTVGVVKKKKGWLNSQS